MRIAEMEVLPVAYREPPLRSSWGAHAEFAARAVVRLTSADGTVRYGETYGDPDVIAEPFAFEDGSLAVPDGPGLGVEVDGAELERLQTRHGEAEARGYSTVESMAAAYADAMGDAGDSGWLPNEPIW